MLQTFCKANVAKLHCITVKHKQLKYCKNEQTNISKKANFNVKYVTIKCCKSKNFKQHVN